MDRSRKADRDTNEATLQHRSRPEALRIDELVAEKLAQLQASIEQLRQTPAGTDELHRRTKAFGECMPIGDESSDRYYERLRRWLDRPIPKTKSPRHPPRQTGR